MDEPQRNHSHSLRSARPPAPLSARGAHGRARGDANRRRFLEALVDTGTIKEALERTGLKRKTYERWRSRYPDFALEADKIRAGGRAVIRSNSHDRSIFRDFIPFRLHYFGFETYWHQRKIVEAIETCPPGGIVLVLVPPEHGKTTLIEDYINYRIALDPNIRITLVSEGQPHARKIMRHIARRMTDVTLGGAYIRDHGPFKGHAHEMDGKPWSADYLTVARAAQDERDYTLECRGWRSTVAGTRTDLMIVDDIQSRRSLNHTSNMIDTFRQDFLSRPGKESKVVIVGTRVGLGDFYQTIQELDIVDRVVALPALNEDGEALAPEMWSAEQLANKRKIVGEPAWWRNYQQQPLADGAEIFTEAMLEDAKDIGLRVGHARHLTDKVCGLDPSLRNETAWTVAAYDTNHFTIVDSIAEPGLGSTENIITRTEYLAITHGFSTLVVEENAFQRGLVQDERLQALGRTYGFRIVAHTTAANKLDEDIGVARMPTSYLQGQVTIPWGDEPTRARMEPLIEQHRSWRPKVRGTVLRQDRVMATWFCWLHWKQWGGVKPSTMSRVRRRGLPWHPARLPKGA